MKDRFINLEVILRFQKYLNEEEKSVSTIDKYVRDVRTFASYVNWGDITKEKVIDYKKHLQNEGYAVRSINSMLASLGSFFRFIGREDLKVKALRLQKQTFCPEEKELTRAEYERLCRAARDKHKERLYLVLQTICSTGIRVGELPFITAETVRNGKAEIFLKGKIRTILLPGKLQKKLVKYITKHNIKKGPVFITRTGKALSRTSIWREMKEICVDAGVDAGKVFPHNLRHLFARIFYALKRDIVKLADVLGHSSINTTRIYIISTGFEHRKCMNEMHLVI